MLAGPITARCSFDVPNPPTMNMLKPAIIVIAIAGAAYAVYSFWDKGGQPGMKEAVFDADDVRTVIDRDSNTTALRFYAARKFKKDVDGTAIMIGTDEAGKDLYEKDTSPYVISLSMIANGTETRDLDEAQALQYLSWIEQVNDSMFAANFSLDEIKTLLDHEGSNGIQLVSNKLDDRGYFTMTAYAVWIEGGKATIIAGAPSYTCAQPCPTYCGGEPRYYLNMRL